MRNAWVILMISLAAQSARAAGPVYESDPFHDADFAEAPLILDVAYPTRGRGELSLFFASSVIDKYTSHLGAMLQFEYHVIDTLGIGITAGMLHGQLTNIVTDEAGIIGRKVEKCMDPTFTCQGIDPSVPDYRQITGLVDLVAIWSPLYGKINVVSELDVSMEAYVLLGAGANGTRVATAQLNGSSPSSPSDYQLSGQSFGDGGFLENTKFNFTGGVGLQILMANWLALRAETRGIFFTDEFDFNKDGTIDSDDKYLSQYWFMHVGLGFILF